MSRIQYVNHFTATLATSIGESDTVLSLTLTNSVAFTVNSGSLVPLSILNPSSLSVYEVVYCTAVSGNSYTVIRGKEGSAQSWPAGALVKCGTTAEILNQACIAGAPAVWSAAVSTLIGGYSWGALVIDSNGTFWVSEADNNGTQPGVAGGAWSSLLGNYLSRSSDVSQTVYSDVVFTGSITVPAVTDLFATRQAADALSIRDNFVKQGWGFSNFGSNSIYLGWRTDGSGLGLGVDSTDIGTLALKSDVTTAENTAATALSAEVSRAESAESNLSNTINQEVSRAQGAESVLSGDIRQETSRAQGVESSLSTYISSATYTANSAYSLASAAVAGGSTSGAQRKGTTLYLASNGNPTFAYDGGSAQLPLLQQLVDNGTFRLVSGTVGGVTQGTFITFPTAFSSAPVVIINSINNSDINCHPYSISSTGFYYHGNAGASSDINYIAYGPK